ncbi:MAG: hypothetical protein EYC62_05295 [Alphaproteobacteria bacterium]|nr:MAG: hypothetical protein EYC62_05295 [Alphaproteobacteria bacterium]
MTATATLEFDPEAPVTDELVEATARFTDDTLGGIAAITRGKTTAIGTIDAQFQSNEQGAAIAGPAGKVSMSGDARGAVGNDNEEENVLDPDLANPELQMKLLAELMAEMGKADFTIESVLEYLLDDRDIPGLEKPSVRRMQQLIQVLHFYALQQASLNAQNAQYWVRSEMIQRLYQQLKIAANGPNPEAAFKALIKTERAAITELRQQLTQQGLAKVPLSQLTAIVVARQLLPLEQVFQQQLTKLQDMLKQAVQNNTNMKYVQVLQMQIAQLQATVKTFQSPALKPLMDYARAINAQIAAQTGQAQNGPARNGQPGQAPQVNFAALPKFAMTAATMQALTQTLQVSRAMLRVQSEWAQGILRVPNTNDVRGVAQTQTIRLPESLTRFWQQQASMRVTQTALRPEPAREIRDQVRQAVREIAQLRAGQNPAQVPAPVNDNKATQGKAVDLKIVAGQDRKSITTPDRLLQLRDAATRVPGNIAGSSIAAPVTTRQIVSDLNRSNVNVLGLRPSTNNVGWHAGTSVTVIPANSNFTSSTKTATPWTAPQQVTPPSNVSVRGNDSRVVPVAQPVSDRAAPTSANTSTPQQPQVSARATAPTPAAPTPIQESKPVPAPSAPAPADRAAVPIESPRPASSAESAASNTFKTEIIRETTAIGKIVDEKSAVGKVLQSLGITLSYDTNRERVIMPSGQKYIRDKIAVTAVDQNTCGPCNGEPGCCGGGGKKYEPTNGQEKADAIDGADRPQEKGTNRQAELGQEEAIRKTNGGIQPVAVVNGINAVNKAPDVDLNAFNRRSEQQNKEGKAEFTSACPAIGGSMVKNSFLGDLFGKLFKGRNPATR